MHYYQYCTLHLSVCLIDTTVRSISQYALLTILYAPYLSMHYYQYCTLHLSVCIIDNTVRSISQYALLPILYAPSLSMHYYQYCTLHLSVCIIDNIALYFGIFQGFKHDHWGIINTSKFKYFKESYRYTLS